MFQADVFHLQKKEEIPSFMLKMEGIAYFFKLKILAKLNDFKTFKF